MKEFMVLTFVWLDIIIPTCVWFECNLAQDSARVVGSDKSLAIPNSSLMQTGITKGSRGISKELP